MESPEVIYQVFQNLLQQEPENIYCFDCGTQGADYASINHGIFLCAQCAGNHAIFGSSVSNVKSWTSEPWTLKQLKFMSVGGNSSFHEFLLRFNISRETPIFALKYKTKAAEYYRCMLDAFSNDLSYNADFPSLEIGIQLIDENSLPYSDYSSSPIRYWEIPIEQPQAENRGNSPLIDNQEKPKGWKAWIKEKYSNAVQLGDKAADKFNNLVNNNPTMKKIDEQSAKAVYRINEEATKFSNHPHVKYMENLAQKASDRLKNAKDSANNFLIGIERDTINYIKNKRSQGQENESDAQ